MTHINNLLRQAQRMQKTPMQGVRGVDEGVWGWGWHRSGRGLRVRGLVRGGACLLAGLGHGLAMQAAADVCACVDEGVQGLAVGVRIGHGYLAGVVFRGVLGDGCRHRWNKNIVGVRASRIAWMGCREF